MLHAQSVEYHILCEPEIRNNSQRGLTLASLVITLLRYIKVVCSLFTVYLLVCLFLVCLLFLLFANVVCSYVVYLFVCLFVCLFFFVLLHGCSLESLSTSSNELFRQSCRDVFCAIFVVSVSIIPIIHVYVILCFSVI